MFSAAATSPVTRDATPSRPSADMAAITAAPPAMSVFICTMPSGGLSDSPPLSNVMPLPTSTMCSCAPAGAYPSSISRGGEADPVHRDEAAEPLRGELIGVPHPGREPGPGGHRHRLVRQPGRGLARGRRVREVTGERHRAGHGPGRRDGVRVPVRPVKQQPHLAWWSLPGRPVPFLGPADKSRGAGPR